MINNISIRHTAKELKELNRREYKTLEALKADEVFKRTDLELLLQYSELEVRWNMSMDEARFAPEAKQTIRYEIKHILLKGEQGDFYRISVEKNIDDFNEAMNLKRYAVQEVNWLDILVIGGWYGNDERECCIHEYHRPKQKGGRVVKPVKIQFKIKKNEIAAEGYFTIGSWNNKEHGIPLTLNWGNFTDKYKGRNLTTTDLFEIADKNGLKRCYINNFEYWKSRR